VASRHELAYQGRAARRELPEADPDDARTVLSCEGRLIAIETLAILRASTTPAWWRAVTCWRGCSQTLRLTCGL
jgi:hypothetical protein